MDALYQSSKVSKFRNRRANMSPLRIKFHNSSSSSDSSLNPGSPMEHFSPRSIISKYKGSGSRSSSNSPLSVVDGEDVLVMDGIMVRDSGGSSTLGNTSNSNSGFFKTQICRSWEDSARCHFGARCQYAHGEVELRPNCLPVNKNKSEVQTCKSYVSGSCIHGLKCRFLHPVLTETRPAITQAPAFLKPEQAITTPFSFDILPTKTPVTPTLFGFEQSTKNHETTLKPEQVSMTSTTITKTVQPTDTSVTSISNKVNDWSPLDDGIEVTLPDNSDKTPSREQIDAYIQRIYHPAERKRLPVFIEICPEL